jgi:hypothetical protein
MERGFEERARAALEPEEVKFPSAATVVED